MRHYLANVGLTWEEKEWQSRANGFAPEYRIVKVAEGVFTQKANAQYSALLRGENDYWTSMPTKYAIHEMQLQSFRALSAALCAKR